MARHVLSVCIFCFICATHSPCASHADVVQENLHAHQKYSDLHRPPLIDNLQIPSREKFKQKLKSAVNTYDDPANVLNIKSRTDHNLAKRDSGDRDNNSNNIRDRDQSAESSHLRKIFFKYGDGETMSLQSFEKLLTRLDLVQILSAKLDSHEKEVTFSREELEKRRNESANKNYSCINREELTDLIQTQQNYQPSSINHTTFKMLCPALISTIISDEDCLRLEENTFQVHDLKEPNNTSFYVWLYSNIAVFIISACGVLALVIIPVMQKRFYKPLIQFLVALAVGTLAGDALLHLLPHAMSPGHEHVHGGHVHSHRAGTDSHDQNMWKGVVAMLGLTFFFFMERFIQLAGKWRKRKQKNRTHSHSHVKVLNAGRDSNYTSDTKCMDKYNSYPYCYKDIKDIVDGESNIKFLESDKTGTTMLEMGSNSDLSSFKKSHSASSGKLETNQNMTECPGNDNGVTSCTEVNKMLPQPEKHDADSNFTVILRDHGVNHHGHSHAHGHVHSAPQNYSSVAWMVIMGDGLHNFTDGMAIGAAFAGNIAGGFSTAVAVFCHELPHELGDFAMLLKAGMSIKQALVYNLLSSLLCILGNIFGVWLGNTEYASSWVFAAAAGMFIYIALVDMIPELSSAHEDESNLTQCILHLSGLLLGFGIMTLIALYEHDLKHIFNDPM